VFGGGIKRGSGPSPAFGGGELVDVGVSGGETKGRWLGASIAAAWGLSEISPLERRAQWLWHFGFIEEEV